MTYNVFGGTLNPAQSNPIFSNGPLGNLRRRSFARHQIMNVLGVDGRR